jgi:hypothetical protein
MRYFTPELITRLNSPDETIANAADAEWDRRLEMYSEELRRIEQNMPEHIRAFRDLQLHDSRVCSLARQGDHLIMVLHKDTPPRDLVVVTYELIGEPRIDKEALPSSVRSEVMDFDYDELSVERQGEEVIFTQSILFSNGWEVQLRFRDVRFVLANPLFVAPALSGLPQSA